MANKYFRKNLNKGGGADSGRMGEIKSKLAVAGMKAKDVMGKSTGGLTKKQIERLKEIMEKRKKDTRKEMIPLKKGGRAALKKGSKFPDLTGDGKVTRADILKGRGAFSKGSKPKNIKDLTRGRLGQFTIAGRLSDFKKKLKKFGSGKK